MFQITMYDSFVTDNGLTMLLTWYTEHQSYRVYVLMLLTYHAWIKTFWICDYLSNIVRLPLTEPCGEYVSCAVDNNIDHYSCEHNFLFVKYFVQYQFFRHGSYNRVTYVWATSTSRWAKPPLCTVPSPRTPLREPAHTHHCTLSLCAMGHAPFQ